MTLRMLTEEERIQAREHARQLVALSHRKPTREQFDGTRASRYPDWFTKLVALMMLIVFIAAALPSLFRLFTAGAEYFRHGIDNHILASIVGVSTFLLAEFLIILSTISARVYFEGKSRWVFVVPISLGLAMALVGNWVIAQPSDVFGWLETLAPPLAVLFLALIGERLVLDAIETRHAAEHAYQTALGEWSLSSADPEQSPDWSRAYANALREALREANSKGRGAKERLEIMAGMSMRQWSPFVARELKARDWFDADATFEDIDAPADQSEPEAKASADENPFGFTRRPSEKVVLANGRINENDNANGIGRELVASATASKHSQRALFSTLETE